MSTRKKYSLQFREEAIRLVRANPDKPVREIGLELGVPQTVLNNWVRRAGGREKPRAEHAPLKAGQPSLDHDRLRELERENARLKLELEFAKKAAAFFARDVK
jgi:transposase